MGLAEAHIRNAGDAGFGFRDLAVEDKLQPDRPAAVRLSPTEGLFLAFRAMAVPARVVGNPDEAALRTALDMTAERRRAARLDRSHDAPFGAAEMTGMGVAVALAVAAEDVRHLERGHDRRISVRRRLRQVQPVERAGRVADRGRRDLGIARRGRQVLMAEQHLDRADIGSGFEQVGSNAVAQGMDAYGLAKLRRFAGMPTHHVEGGRGERPGPVSPGKQPVFRPNFLLIGAQHEEQLCRQHDVSVAVSFALFDPNQHAVAVDIGDSQAYNFRDSQTGGIGGHQRCPELQARHRREKSHDFFGTQDHGKLVVLARVGDALDHFGAPHGDTRRRSAGPKPRR